MCIVGKFMMTVKIYMINTIIILMCYFKITIIKVYSNFLAVVLMNQAILCMGVYSIRKKEFVDNYDSF